VRERQLALYGAKVSWMDHWLGKVLDGLDETGLADNTAIILTADHGTNLGERGGFGKTGIVNEQEAHVPLLLRMPGLVPGRNGDFVQPQDIFTTILNLAGVTPPDGTVGHNLLGGETMSRTLAIGGPSVVSWQDDPHQIVLTVFDDNWYLNIAADPAACRLFRYGCVDNIADAHMDIVIRLREKTWDELARRDTNPGLLNWLSSGGESPFEEVWTKWIGPPEWRTYWERVYEE
jgi:arylsulfatase A-like enzyme